VGLLENANYVALDVAIAVHVRGLQTGSILVKNQPFRVRQIIRLPMVGPRPAHAPDCCPGTGLLFAGVSQLLPLVPP
jgi:hypothetical protein